MPVHAISKLAQFNHIISVNVQHETKTRNQKEFLFFIIKNNLCLVLSNSYAIKEHLNLHIRSNCRRADHEMQTTHTMYDHKLDW